MNDRSPFSTLVLGLAVVLAGLLIGRGIERFRAADRSVSVKGVAERTVQADVGLWPVRMVAADNDLDLAQRR
ncbi:MAG: SIMPL domain-containing protein, partial [Candidatus Eiseniibacteriota bacterium]